MQSAPIIYLDYNATTPVAPEVVNEMLPFFLSSYGNASSGDHIFGWQAKEAVEKARDTMAEAINVKASQVIFTAGATESINMVLRGLRNASKDQKNHIITVKTEHSAILDTCKAISGATTEVTYLDVNSSGLIDLDDLKEAIQPNTVLVAVMWVNNETGVIQPIQEIANICKERGVIFLSDATQAIGKLNLDIEKTGVDIVVGSAHKIYGPKGVGFLYVAKAINDRFTPLITGGGQEFKKRAGTLNVPGIVGFGKAVDLALSQLSQDSERIKELRDRFEVEICSKFEVSVNGRGAERLYSTSNLAFKGHDSEKIMQKVGSKLAASRGSACSTGKINPSHVLSSMGLTDGEAHSSIRFSFGRYTTDKELDAAIRLLNEALSSS